MGHEIQDLQQLMHDMGQRAKQAAGQLAMTPTAQKNMALNAMADQIEAQAPLILEANARDLQQAQDKAVSPALIDRLTLDENHLASIAQSVRDIAALPDPIGTIIEHWTRPNGLLIERVRTPLGVIGIIYESRPNVTADAGALALKSGNAVILRGGSDSIHSSKAIHKALSDGLNLAGITTDAIQLVQTTDRAAVGAMLQGLDGAIDVIVPRGGKSLVARVQAEARVPVFAHLEGLCHLYIDHSADADMACRIAVNSKMRRTGICGATETLLLDRALDPKTVTHILNALHEADCEIRGDADIQQLDPQAQAATQEDWQTEYLDAIISVRMVDGIDGAIEHINRYSSHHTEAIIAEDMNAVDLFFSRIDSAILLHNASTQFADGGEFGMGAEIGIATGKMHARGPIGVAQLTSFKYRVHGTGQLRP